MARYDAEVRITLSVLDRLIDYEPELSHEPVSSRAKSLRLLKQSVRRDLEWLLNTRQVVTGVPEGLTEVASSIHTYGLPDFTIANLANPADQNRIRRALENAIRIFEPRLEGAVITFESSSTNVKDRTVHFRIEGRLKVEPAPEPVSFDTIFEPGRSEFEVKGEG